MTNAEKYLKDGVTTEDLIREIQYPKVGIEIQLVPPQYLNAMIEHIRKLLNTPIRPTLTEDEKVILKSIKDDNWAIIGKTDFNELYLANYCKNCDVFVKEIFKKDLFQFIQPRRRI